MADKKNKGKASTTRNAADATQTVNLRNLVLTMLADTLDNGVFSHVVVNNAFSENALEGRERSFVSRLYLGVLERLIYIDYCINKVSSTNTMKMKPVVLNILREGTYQLLFMDSVPDHAAINEAGKLAKKRGFTQLVSFVNAVLRAVSKTGREEFEKEMPENVRLSVPKWMFETVSEQSGEETAREFFEGALNGEKNVTIRLNTYRAVLDKVESIMADESMTGETVRSEIQKTEAIAKEQIIASLSAEGCEVTGNLSGDSFVLRNFESLTGLKSYKQGLFSVQDTSSVMAALTGARALEEVLGGRDKDCLIVDVCSAPGGKSICVSQHLPKAKIISRDLTEYKIGLIKENIARLGIDSIKPELHDALVLDEKLVSKADMVIADLPCSGLGVIGGKPDIKFRVRKKDLEELEKLQRNILDVVSKYVKPGGILLYSTCTINKGENDDNAGYIVSELGFECISRRQIMEGLGDGFFISVMKKE